VIRGGREKEGGGGEIFRCSGVMRKPCVCTYHLILNGMDRRTDWGKRKEKKKGGEKRKGHQRALASALFIS